MKNLLTDFERAEYYRVRYKSRGMLIIVFSVLSFILGFLVARLLYV